METDLKKYTLPEFSYAPAIDADWNKTEWQKVKPLTLDNCMGQEAAFVPAVQAKMAYDRTGIFGIFRVEDRYIKAIAQQHHDPVCRDSCVEFFFTPGEDMTLGYMNLEMNCCGKMLFNHQQHDRSMRREVTEDDLDKIAIAHSLPYERIENEIKSPTVWTLEFQLPFAVIKKYIPNASTGRGSVWRGNFYKCGNDTSFPHWLTWSFIDNPVPDFHKPEYFGLLTLSSALDDK